jgi:D-alanine-D-alanine ligase
VKRLSKTRVGVLFGGRSGEHEVSLMSAASIMRTLLSAGYEVVPIGIDKAGRWLMPADNEAALRGIMASDAEPVVMLPQPGEASIVTLNPGEHSIQKAVSVDVIFPAMHGTYGEDGSIQGLLEMADLPYVGAGVLASAVGMDKDIQKRLYREAGVPVLDFKMFLRSEFEKNPDGVIEQIEAQFTYPLFVKPCNLGSSVGVHKARDAASLKEALEDASLYDRKILIEECAVDCHEIECSVLGNDDPVASMPGEIIPAREFYDYAAKYIDGRSYSQIPARLPAGVIEKVRELSVKCYKLIDCAGMARVDFFVSKDGHAVWVNELNTIPGFTKISMYPKMWEGTGLTYEELLTRLIDLALERHKDKNRRVTEYQPPEEIL